MIVKPTSQKRIQGLLIRTALIVSAPRPHDVQPTYIELYKFPQLPIKIYNQGEYYTRQFHKGLMKNISINYIVDRFAAWKILPGPRKDGKKDVIGVAICGNNKRAEDNFIKMIALLLKDYDLGFNSLIYKAQFSDNFQTLLSQQIKQLNIPYFKPIELEEKVVVQQPPVQLIAEYCYNDEWKSWCGRAGIEKIRLQIDNAKLYYRVHLYRGQWSDWYNNGEIAGKKGFLIDGIQYEFQLEDYSLYHSFSTSTTKPIPMKTTCYSIPLNKPFNYLEFKLVKN